MCLFWLSPDGDWFRLVSNLVLDHGLSGGVQLPIQKKAPGGPWRAAQPAGNIKQHKRLQQNTLNKSDPPAGQFHEFRGPYRLLR